MPDSRAPEIAVVLKGYPRLSETFIAQEIRGLERKGLALGLYSLRHPTDPAVHPVHREITAATTYLPEYLKDEPRRVWAGWQRARRFPGYRRALRIFFRDLRRDPSSNRLRRFGQAAVLAAELPATTLRIYAHFLHTPASVARYAALMRGLPWCASAHAKDVWTTPEWEIREKIADCEWLVTCSAAGESRLKGLAEDPEKVALLYHGLDFARFGPVGKQEANDRDGRDDGQPVRLLSVGRPVAKKGYDCFLEALAALPPELSWHLTHIGGGELAADLKALAARLGLESRIDWQGPQPQERVIEAYRRADLFVLASRVAVDGDRDGLPNVLMEAQSQRLCCLSTRVSAIPELIIDGETGVLVPPDDQPALTEALRSLISNPGERERLSQAGEARVRAHFSMASGIEALHARFHDGAHLRAAE